MKKIICVMTAIALLLCVFSSCGSSFTVNFVDYNGLALASVSVKEGGTAMAPENPSREGYTFSGWSSSLNNVRADMTATAIYSFNGGNNVFDLSYSVESENTFTVTATVKGNVKFAVLEGWMNLPDGITYRSVDAGDDRTLVNFNDGTIYFSTTSTDDITADTVIFTATCTYADPGAYTFRVTIDDICDRNLEVVSASVIGESFKIW